MNLSSPTSRRTVLAGASAAIGVALTAGCSDSDDPAVLTDPGGGGDPLASTAPPAGPEDEPTEDAEGGAEGGNAGNALAKFSDIPAGTAVSAESKDGKPLIVCRFKNGKVAAFSAVCTHQGCTVEPAGKSLDCPCHGSKFSPVNGEVLHGPATKPLKPYAVKLDGDDIVPDLA
jgi:Rieske Fe-S protein